MRYQTTRMAQRRLIGRVVGSEIGHGISVIRMAGMQMARSNSAMLNTIPQASAPSIQNDAGEFYFVLGYSALGGGDILR